MALIDKPERARQLARAIASDLTLYHESKILDGLAKDNLFDVMRDEIEEGLAKDNLFDVMRDDIEEGRALYKSRVTPEIYNLNLYDRALVDVMLKSKAHVKSKIW